MREPSFKRIRFSFYAEDTHGECKASWVDVDPRTAVSRLRVGGVDIRPRVHDQRNAGGKLEREEVVVRVTAVSVLADIATADERERVLATEDVVAGARERCTRGRGGNGAIGDLLTSTYGSLARWEELFRATGMSLGGGSGWVALVHDLPSGAVHISWSDNHTQADAAGLPLLVMDMYEHAYQMDYGAATAKYIDAFFANLHWAEVNRRLERAQKAAALLRG